MILKKKYMIMVWDYVLVAYKSKIFANTILNYWFIDDIAQYQPFYNGLFLIIGTLVVKFSSLIILNLNKDCKNKTFQEVSREMDHLLPIKLFLQ